MSETTQTTSPSRRPADRQWNHQVQLPVQVSPVFIWPPNPRRILSWFWNSWFLISEKFILVGIAFVCWLYLHPALERCKQFEFGWIAEIHLRNLGLMFLVAGGLHLYFYTWKRQGNDRKYDARPLARGRAFTLGNQVFDNMIWSCASGVTIWTAYEAVMMWSFANGYLSILNFSENPVWFVVIFALVPLWESHYFYWIHRLLHVKVLYDLAHNLHHRNTNVGPWSGFSMHPIEHILYLGSVLVHWLIVSHPVHVMYHLQYLALTAATTHSGFEGVVVKDKNRLALGTFHHQMHHRYFECNYGSLEIPWDKWFGSMHDGTPESHERMKKRRWQQAEG